MITELAYKMNLWMLGVSEEENELWYSAGCVNGIFKTNVITGATERIGVFSKLEITGERLFDINVSTRDKIFFLPFHTYLLAVYDKKTRMVEYFPLVKDNEVKLRIGMGFVFNEYIVMISYKKDMPIMMYDYMHNVIYQIKDIYRLIKEQVVYEAYVFAQGYYIYKSILYLVIGGTWQLLCVDLASRKAMLIDMGGGQKKNGGINAMTGNEDKLYLFEENGGMTIWSIKERKIKAHKKFEPDLEKGKMSVQNAIVLRHNVWIFLAGTEKVSDVILKYSCETDVVEKICLKEKKSLSGGFIKDFHGYLFAQKIEENVIIALSINSNQLFYIDEAEDLIKTINLECDGREYIEVLLDKKPVREELLQDGMQVLCDRLLKQTGKTNVMEERDTYGALIYKKIESMVHETR